MHFLRAAHESEGHTIVRLALLQALILFMGYMTLSAILKLFGYPDAAGVRWNSVAVWLRHYGLLLSLVPVVWSVIMLVLTHRNFIYLNRIVVISGVAIASGMGLLFLANICRPYRTLFVMGAS